MRNLSTVVLGTTAFAILKYSDKHAGTSRWKRPRRSASQPPVPMPEMTSNTSHGRGLLVDAPLFLAIVSKRSSRITSVEMACNPPPSRVRILSGFRV